MQKVLITGGNKGIGLETTKIFLKNKFEVTVVARDFEEFELKKEVEYIEFDLGNVSEISKIKKEVGEVDVLVNNAGIMHALPFNEYPEEKKREILAVNLESPLKLIEEFSKSMIKNKAGRIVNTASIAGEVGHPDIWYGITKAGIINVTKSFAKILGPMGIVVNCVAPGPVETDMLATIPDERKAALKKSSILGRFAKPEEVAQTVYWLATDCPEHINGICVDINNGAFMR
jgi:NAD(P)-dependent dehydrogenase (short-subunit alcohol dehydrogenase family)